MSLARQSSPLMVGGMSYQSGTLFTKQTDVLPQDLVKSRSREIGCYNYRVALKFDSHMYFPIISKRLLSS